MQIVFYKDYIETPGGYEFDRTESNLISNENVYCDPFVAFEEVIQMCITPISGTKYAANKVLT